MAAHARQLAALLGLHALSMPAGEPPSFVHCHAYNTTIHTARERAYPPDRDRLSLPLLGGPPLMDPLDVFHGVLRCWRAGAWGGLGARAPARFRR